MTYPHPAPQRIRHLRHRVSVDDRFVLTDRCSSGLLWWTVARSCVQGRAVRLDGQRVDWAAVEALSYLQRTAQRKWWADLG